MDWYDETFRATVVLVVASAVLAVPGFAGIGASVPLFFGYGVLAGFLFLGRDRLAAWPTVLEHDVGGYGAVLWLGPAVAALVCLGALGSTPGELQALGGVVGLVGMANYFLRPVYRAGIGLVRRVRGATG